MSVLRFTTPSCPRRGTITRRADYKAMTLRPGNAPQPRWLGRLHIVIQPKLNHRRFVAQGCKVEAPIEPPRLERRAST